MQSLKSIKSEPTNRNRTLQVQSDPIRLTKQEEEDMQEDIYWLAQQFMGTQPLLDVYQNRKQITRKLQLISKEIEMLTNSNRQLLKRLCNQYKIMGNHIINMQKMMPQLGREMAKLQQELYRKLPPQNKYPQRNINYYQRLEQIQDKAYYNYLQYARKLEGRVSDKYVNRNLNYADIDQRVAQCWQFYDELALWRQIFSLTNYFSQQAAISSFKSNQSQKDRYNRYMTYSRHIFRFVPMNVQCLGCSPFFYKHSTVYDPNITLNKLAVIESVSLLDKEEGKRLILREICGLLNGGGGILLFGCQKRHLNVIAEGQCLTESDKRIIAQNIEHLCRKIRDLKEELSVNFVPIAKHPTEMEIDYEYSQKQGSEQQLQFFEGLYVTRIIIRPLNSNYILQEAQKLITVTRFKSIASSGDDYLKVSQVETGLLTGNQQHSFDDFRQASLKDWSPEHSQFDHTVCSAPLKGKILLTMPQPEKAETDPQKRFRFVSGLVSKPHNIPIIRQRLTQKYGIMCQIDERFHKYKNVRGAVLTAVLYHSVPFSELQRLVTQNQDFKFEQRYLVLAQITDFVKLLERVNRNRLPKEKFGQLQNWIEKQFASERLKLRMFSYVNDYQEVEYYLSTGSRPANLFLYLVLNYLGEKSGLKNPQRIQSVQQLN